eukprot:5246787-Heterocapsa_arctica.AAC.1
MNRVCIGYASGSMHQGVHRGVRRGLHHTRRPPSVRRYASEYASLSAGTHRGVLRGHQTL